MKKVIALSMVASMVTAGFASTDVETRLNKMEKKIKKLERKLKRSNKKLNMVKAHDAGDNIKWDVDFRTTVDNIEYKMANGDKRKSSSMLANRLLLGMKFKADDTVTFYGTLGYNKVYGATTGASNGFEGFDWVTNETASTDSNIKLKEAYWLYANDTFMGADMPGQQVLVEDQVLVV